MIDQRKLHQAAVDELLDRLVREQILNRILERALSDATPGRCGHGELLATIRVLHTPLPAGSPICFECNVRSPCRTLQLLTAPVIDAQEHPRNTAKDE